MNYFLKTCIIFLFNLVPEEQLTEFVESKDHMIILEVFKEFPEKEEVILPALYSLHSLAGPCKCIIENHSSHILYQLASVRGNLLVTVNKIKLPCLSREKLMLQKWWLILPEGTALQWELVGSGQANHISVFYGKYWLVIFNETSPFSAILVVIISPIKNLSSAQNKW